MLCCSNLYITSNVHNISVLNLELDLIYLNVLDIVNVNFFTSHFYRTYKVAKRISHKI